MLLETNRQWLALKNHIQRVTKEELRSFIGICLYMTIVDLPFRRMHKCIGLQQQNNKLSLMSLTCNRFEQILAIIHLNDSEMMKAGGDAAYERLHRMRPLLNKLNIRFDWLIDWLIEDRLFYQPSPPWAVISGLNNLCLTILLDGH